MCVHACCTLQQVRSIVSTDTLVVHGDASISKFGHNCFKSAWLELEKQDIAQNFSKYLKTSDVDIVRNTSVVPWSYCIMDCCTHTYQPAFSYWIPFNMPPAAVVIRSKPWPTWSAWHLVLSSTRNSLASDTLGRYCKLRSSLTPALWKKWEITVLSKHCPVGTIQYFKWKFYFSSARKIILLTTVCIFHAAIHSF